MHVSCKLKDEECDACLMLQYDCVQGKFNGDPHPGNILLLSDGRLGLIDYGQVKNISMQDRIKYAKLIIAHTRGDRKVLFHLCILPSSDRYIH